MTIVIIGFILLVVFLVMGMPVVYAFGVACIVMVVGLGYDMSFIISTAFTRISSFILLCIPLFVLAGGIIEKAEMGRHLVNFINLFIGRFKCSLAFVSTLTCGLFGALSGSAAATATCVGSIMTPRMKEAGYPDGFIGALFSSISMLGILIPPSALMIIVAFATGLNPLTCFLSTLVPGIVLMIFFCIVSWFILRNNKDIKPAEKISFKEWTPLATKTTGKAIPILCLPVIMLGGIYGGFMTPTESAAVGTFYAVIAGLFIYRTLKIRVLKESLIESATTAGVIMMSIFMVGVLSKILIYAGLPEIIADFVQSLTVDKYIILLMINIVLVLVGMVMDDMSAILICAPIFLPLASDVGVDPYHFAAIIGVNMGMAAITPPAAPSLYTCCRICGSKIKDMLIPDLQFIAFAWIPTLILTTVFPAMALFIPQQIGLL